MAKTFGTQTCEPRNPKNRNQERSKMLRKVLAASTPKQAFALLHQYENQLDREAQEEEHVRRTRCFQEAQLIDDSKARRGTFRSPPGEAPNAPYKRPINRSFGLRLVPVWHYPNRFPSHAEEGRATPLATTEEDSMALLGSVVPGSSFEPPGFMVLVCPEKVIHFDAHFDEELHIWLDMAGESLLLPLSRVCGFAAGTYTVEQLKEHISNKATQYYFAYQKMQATKAANAESPQ